MALNKQRYEQVDLLEKLCVVASVILAGCSQVLTMMKLIICLSILSKRKLQVVGVGSSR